MLVYQRVSLPKNQKIALQVLQGSLNWHPWVPKQYGSQYDKRYGSTFKSWCFFDTTFLCCKPEFFLTKFVQRPGHLFWVKKTHLRPLNPICGIFSKSATVIAWKSFFFNPRHDAHATPFWRLKKNWRAEGSMRMNVGAWRRRLEDVVL